MRDRELFDFCRLAYDLDTAGPLCDWLGERGWAFADVLALYRAGELSGIILAAWLRLHGDERWEAVAEATNLEGIAWRLQRQACRMHEPIEPLLRGLRMVPTMAEPLDPEGKRIKAEVLALFPEAPAREAAA